MPPVASVHPTKNNATISKTIEKDPGSLRLPAKPALKRAGGLGDAVDSLLTSGRGTGSDEAFDKFMKGGATSGADSAREQIAG